MSYISFKPGDGKIDVTRISENSVGQNDDVHGPDYNILMDIMRREETDDGLEKMYEQLITGCDAWIASQEAEFEERPEVVIQARVELADMLIDLKISMLRTITNEWDEVNEPRRGGPQEYTRKSNMAMRHPSAAKLYHPLVDTIACKSHLHHAAVQRAAMSINNYVDTQYEAVRPFVSLLPAHDFEDFEERLGLLPMLHRSAQHNADSDTHRDPNAIGTLALLAATGGTLDTYVQSKSLAELKRAWRTLTRTKSESKYTESEWLYVQSLRTAEEQLDAACDRKTARAKGRAMVAAQQESTAGASTSG